MVDGKKIVKSVQDRLLEVKEYLHNQVLLVDPGLKKKFYSQKPEDIAKYNQKYILTQIKTRNKKGRGPYLRRPDSLLAKMLQKKRSMAVKIVLDTLPGIETVMTNFNQIVIREA